MWLRTIFIYLLIYSFCLKCFVADPSALKMEAVCFSEAGICLRVPNINFYRYIIIYNLNNKTF
jgi:hypothetical protein